MTFWAGVISGISFGVGLWLFSATLNWLFDDSYGISNTCLTCHKGSGDFRFQWMCQLWTWMHALRNPNCRSDMLRRWIGPKKQD